MQMGGGSICVVKRGNQPVQCRDNCDMSYVETTVTCHMSRQLWHVICRDNCDMSYVETTVTCHMSKQLWHVICRDNCDMSYVETTVTCHMSRQLWHVICRDNCDMSYGIWQSQITRTRFGPKMITVTVFRVIHPRHNATRRWRASVSNLRWKKIY